MKWSILLIHIISITMIKAQDVHAWQFANWERYAQDNANQSSQAMDAIFIGNSITEGWVNVMPDFFKINNYLGRGIGGQTSAQLLLRFMPDVVNLKPKVVVIQIGINDIAENTGPYHEDFTISNILAMVHLAKSNNIKVILASVLPASHFVWRPSVTQVAEKVEHLNQKIQALAATHHVAYLDYHSRLKNKEGGLDKNMAEDGVHPTLACYTIMAELAHPLIQQILQQ